MSSIALYGIPNLRHGEERPRSWLDRQGRDYVFHDYKKEGAGTRKSSPRGSPRPASTRWSTARARPFRKLSESEKGSRCRQSHGPPCRFGWSSNPVSSKRPIVEHPGGYPGRFQGRTNGPQPCSDRASRAGSRACRRERWRYADHRSSRGKCRAARTHAGRLERGDRSQGAGLYRARIWLRGDQRIWCWSSPMKTNCRAPPMSPPARSSRDRRRDKIIDGQKVAGWFAEDFTLAELAQPCAPGNVSPRSVPKMQRF